MPVASGPARSGAGASGRTSPRGTGQPRWGCIGSSAASTAPTGLRSDASGQPEYNHLVRAPYPHSHEDMRRADPMYDVVLLTDWNWPDAQAGRGSAIFLHQWRGWGRPTAGCIAFARRDLLRIAALAAPGTRLVVPEGLAYSG